jgi:hypothetical protein
MTLNLLYKLVRILRWLKPIHSTQIRSLSPDFTSTFSTLESSFRKVETCQVLPRLVAIVLSVGLGNQMTQLPAQN